MEKKYSNGEVSILWKPELCIHSGNCVRGLPEVFRPKEKPWIQADMASTQSLIDQVRDCPSGALSIFNEIEPKKENKLMEKKETVIEVTTNGPVKVNGPCEIVMADGSSQSSEKDVWLCRCGISNNKPFCDGSHRKSGFSPDTI